MFYIYRPASSTGARQLAEALEGRRIRDVARMRPRAGDTVVAWGVEYTAPPGVTVLGGQPIRSKLADAEVLRRAGVSTIEVSRQRPMVAAPVVAPPDPALSIYGDVQHAIAAFQAIPYNRGSVIYIDGVTDLNRMLTRFETALRTPLPPPPAPVPAAEWIGRVSNHMGGTDLLHPPAQPDYFVKKETFVREFRVHSFKGRSIRAGVKQPREGFAQPHEWVRSWDGGWRISYDGATIRQAHRDIAHAAVNALGLDFGAVDIGERADRSLVVLEVNRAPGLEGGTIAAYANAIRGGGR